MRECYTNCMSKVGMKRPHAKARRRSSRIMFLSPQECVTMPSFDVDMVLDG